MRESFAGIEELCSKRDELHRQILEEEEEKRKIQNDLRILTERLSKVNEMLSKKTASRNEFDKTISETEAAYMKVCVKTVMWQILRGILKKLMCCNFIVLNNIIIICVYWNHRILYVASIMICTRRSYNNNIYL